MRVVVLAARRFLARRHLAALLCVATLLVRLLVPGGYMIGGAHGRVTVELCPGVAPAPMAMAGMHGDEHGRGSHEHGRAEMPCAFAGLSAPSLGAADPIQLATLIAFVVALGRLPARRPAPVRRGYLRPPLRGPPVPR